MNFIKCLFKKNKAVLDDDKKLVYLVSYPKSGRTWLRALLARYLIIKYEFDENKLFSTTELFLQCKLSKLVLTHDGTELNKRCEKFSNENHINKLYVNKDVILLGREIKDTLVSSYFHAKERKKFFVGNMSEFLRDEKIGSKKILGFYKAWKDTKNTVGKFKFVSYEGLHEDTHKNLSQILTFLGEKVIDEESLQKSIDYCQVENLRKLEKNNVFSGSRALRAHDSSNPESFKVRRALVGGYVDYLSKEDISFVDEEIKNSGFNLSDFES